MRKLCLALMFIAAAYTAPVLAEDFGELKFSWKGQSAWGKIGAK